MNKSVVHDSELDLVPGKCQGLCRRYLLCPSCWNLLSRGTNISGNTSVYVVNVTLGTVINRSDNSGPSGGLAFLYSLK